MSAAVLDAHVHVWDQRALEYPWLSAVSALDRSFPPDAWDRADGQVTECVFVEANAREPRAEAARVASLGERWPELRGIVAGVDLRHADIDAQLADLAGLPKVVGVRHTLQDLTAAELADPALSAGLRAVGRAGLTFDACTRWWQLDAVTRLAREAPETPVVLDHLGKPPLGSGDADDWRRWRTSLRLLAAEPHTFVKLSGLPAETRDPRAFHHDAARALDATLEAFGATRSMYGSDWPVSARTGAAMPASEWLGFVRARVGADDWRAVSRGTAIAFYGLPG